MHHRRPVVFVPPRPPAALFALVPLFAVAALLVGTLGIVGFVLGHPLLLAGGLYLAYRAHRRRRGGSRRFSSPVGRGPARGTRWGRSSARRAYHAAVAAVDASDFGESEKAELRGTLQTSLEEIEGMLDAEARLDAGGSFDGVGRAARERAERFEADCRSLEASLAAMRIQNRGTDGLDALSSVADEMAGRVAAQDEVDALR